MGQREESTRLLHQAHGTRRNQQAFTLVELAVVMVIISVLAGVFIPVIMQSIPNFNLKSLAYSFLAASQEARGLAIKQNQNVTLSIDASGYSYTVDSDGDGDIDSSDTPISTSFSDYGSTGQGHGNYATVDWEGSTNFSTTTSFTFTSRGTLGSGVQGSVFFDNGESGSDNQLCYAITISNTGAAQIRKYAPCDDSDQKNCWLE